MRLEWLSDKIIIFVLFRAASWGKSLENVLKVDRHALGDLELKLVWILIKVLAVKTEALFLVRVIGTLSIVQVSNTPRVRVQVSNEGKVRLHL